MLSGNLPTTSMLHLSPKTIAAIGAVLSLAVASIILQTAAFAQPQPPGIERADEEVHENTGPVSKQDVVFHEGLCQAGITTEALEGLGGCVILTAPGSSDEVRQDP
jgi:hypothetical protein